MNRPLTPGAAFKRELPQVGHASVLFNAATLGCSNFLALSCASFNKVWLGSNLLARAISIMAYRRAKTAEAKMAPQTRSHPPITLPAAGQLQRPALRCQSN